MRLSTFMVAIWSALLALLVMANVPPVAGAAKVENRTPFGPFNGGTAIQSCQSFTLMHCTHKLVNAPTLCWLSWRSMSVVCWVNATSEISPFEYSSWMYFRPACHCACAGANVSLPLLSTSNHEPPHPGS